VNEETQAREGRPHAGHEAPENQEPETDEMPFLEHLEELRWRLFKSIVAIGLAALISFFFSDYILRVIQRPFEQAVAMQPEVIGEDGATIAPRSQLIFLSPTEGFMIRIKLSLLAGLLLASPIVFYQFWKFVSPGLLEKERKFIPRLAFASTVFFLLGASFCYFFVIRFGLNFLLGFQSETLAAVIDIKEYFGFFTLLILMFGIVFEMPIVAYFLTRLGLLTPEFMRDKRQYAIVGIFVLAAIITPPDIFTQMALALPLLILYEISIWVCKASLPSPREASPQT